jgi:hypothetical protein
MRKKAKTIIFIILGVIALLMSFFVFALVIVVYNMPDFSSHSQYGIVKIVVDGKQLYFKRVVRGRNHDAIILSSNENHCAEYNPESDYDFTSMDTTIFYKTDGGALYLLEGNPTIQGYPYKPNIVQPKNFPVKVMIIEPDKLLEFGKNKELYKDKGLEFLEIPLDDTLKCK